MNEGVFKFRLVGTGHYVEIASHMTHPEQRSWEMSSCESTRTPKLCRKICTLCLPETALPITKDSFMVTR